MTPHLDHFDALGCAQDVASANSMYAYRDRGVVQKWPVLGNTDNKDPSVW